ncbi:MAG: ATP synthase F1 subunit epsilon [Acidimicrobiia bacterium]
MAKTFHLEIVSPEAMVWRGEVEFLSTRTTEGEIGILADHEATMAPLATSTSVVHTPQGERINVAVHGGFLQIFRNQVTVLSDRAEIAEGDLEAVRERAEELAAEAAEEDG